MMHFCRINWPGDYECDAHCENMNRLDFIGYRYVFFEELKWIWGDWV